MEITDLTKACKSQYIRLRDPHVPGGETRVRCVWCNGKDVVPSPKGQQLLEWLLEVLASVRESGGKGAR